MSRIVLQRVKDYEGRLCWKCPYDDTTFLTLDNLKKHLVMLHGIKETDELRLERKAVLKIPAIENDFCPLCGSGLYTNWKRHCEAFHNKNDPLNGHLNPVPGRIYVFTTDHDPIQSCVRCECGAYFYFEADLKTHQTACGKRCNCPRCSG
ncbi:MAG: hypothetical protein ACUVTD_08685 [Nitrososphaerales archaeon]